MVNCYIQIQHDLISQFNHISCFYHNILYFSMRTLTTRIASITTFFISACVLWQRELLLSQHSLFQHAYFDNMTFYYDIAMIKLERRAVITNAVRPIDLTSPATETFDSDSRCAISGWGNSHGKDALIFCCFVFF